MEYTNTKNKYFVVTLGNKEYIKFITGGKYKVEVITDLHTWEKYLYKYHWTVTLKGRNYQEIKTSMNKHSVRLARMIVEHEYEELDYWGNTVDHINNNPLDNRIENLRLCNSKFNASNIKSKYLNKGLNLIFPQTKKRNGREYVSGYKVHTNIFDETIYANFPTIKEAKEYRDNIVFPYIERRLEELKKKSRDIEFERGLRDKIKHNEIEEVNMILKKYSYL